MSTAETSTVRADRGIRVLALDGGGIRGLSSLVLLRELMQRIAVTVQASAPIRPCDYFDLIMGTGTGGLSALFIGRMCMTVDEAIEAYLLMGAKGFKRCAVPALFQRMRSKEVLFDGDSVTHVIGDIVEKYVGDREAQLHEPLRSIGAGRDSCRTAVLATSSASASDPPHVFRSYPTSWDPASTHTIHEVARATTATAGGFPPISIGFPSIKFIEAGVAGYNNPAEEALNEVERVWPGARITCLISIGTGLQNIVRVGEALDGAMKVVKRQMEDCEKVHERLIRRRARTDLPYYRFNVTTGLDAAGITEWDEETRGFITTVTEGYVRKGDVDGVLNSCVKILAPNTPAASFEARSSPRLLKTITDGVLAEKIFTWLNAPDSSENYNTASEKHERGTGMWFINGRDFSQWKNGRGSFLCIYGKPGCGKTILCSSIISHVAEVCNQGTSCAYAYFFFDGRNAQTKLQLHNSLIRSLIRQFTQQCNGIPVVLVEGYRDGFQQLPTRGLEDILQHILDGFTDAYVIIDSVDECIERVKLLNWITKISLAKSGNLNVLVTSRPEEDIASILRSRKMVSISMEEEIVNRDIEKYIDSKIQEGRLRRWPKMVRLRVKEQLMERAQGMFRWLAIQLDELQNCLDEAELDEQLKRLPRDLDDTYHQILAKIPEQRRARVKTFLQWTAFSVHPPTLDELGEAAAVEFPLEKAPKYNPRRRFEPRDVLAACASLIVESEGYVKLSHFSVKEYLLSDCISSGTISYFGINETLSHSHIAQICLAYLLQFDLVDDLEVLSEFPLAMYAAQNWIFHTQSGGNESSPMVVNLITTLLKCEISLTNWIQLYDPDDPWRFSTHIPVATNFLNPLYYASLLGFTKVSQLLLDRFIHPDAMHGWDINSPGGQCGTALSAACGGGHVATVQMLLEHGANVNITRGGHDALWYASGEGHTEVVKMLLDYGATVTAHNGAALQHASREGHIEVVKILLDQGTGIHTFTGWSSIALMHASEKGQIEIVKMLLDHGATTHDGAALQPASREGHIEVVKMLLDHGAGISTLIGWSSIALVSASEEGHIDIVKMLLDHGAMTTTHDGAALRHAADKGHVDVVKMLLEHGAKVNVRYGGALVYASAKGHDEVVKMLLEHGADINARNGAAPQVALKNGHDATVKLLLNHGATALSDVQGTQS